jgi:hypothetical protein
MAAKKRRSGAVPKKAKKRARPAKRAKARTKPKVEPATGMTPKRLPGLGGALLNASPLNTFALNEPPTYLDGATIAAWRQERKTAAISTGGAVERVLVPLDSFPPVTPQPNLARTASPQLDAVSPVPDVAGLDDDEAADVIQDWFLSNFDDPVQSMPRIDGEFLYILGGPYDARDEIVNAFSESVPEHVVEAAIRAIEAGGVDDWAPHAGRERPDHEEQAGVDASDANALHAEMIEQIEALERAMAGQRERRRRGIGHNKPPEPIEDPPLSTKDLGEIRTAMAVLKRQPPVPSVLSIEARTAVTLLMKFGDRLRPLGRTVGGYILKQADSFVTKAVEKAGEEVGKRIVQSPFWIVLINKIPALADVAHRWLESLPHF